MIRCLPVRTEQIASRSKTKLISIEHLQRARPPAPVNEIRTRISKSRQRELCPSSYIYLPTSAADDWWNSSRIRHLGSVGCCLWKSKAHLSCRAPGAESACLVGEARPDAPPRPWHTLHHACMHDQVTVKDARRWFVGSSCLCGAGLLKAAVELSLWNPEFPSHFTDSPLKCSEQFG